jgi:hypothetical protein
LDFGFWIEEFSRRGHREHRGISMTQNVGHILKKNQVKFSGTCKVDEAAVPVRTAAAGRTTGPAEPARCQSQVRIVETNEQGFVLEFLCSCGEQTYIQCDHAGA